jgi:hypothetical protein
MSNQQRTNFRRLKQLFRQLAGYGLNPYDWKVAREQSNTDGVYLYHREDRDFRFRGRIARTSTGEMQLRHLRLISL